MKKKSPRNADASEVLIQIQEQLAMLNNKFDHFINKSLTDLAQTLAAQKAAASARPIVTTPQPSQQRPTQQQNARPKFAIVCFQCGKDSELPFKPVSGRPVYCSECFALRKSGNLVKTNPPLPSPIKVETPLEVKKPEPVVTKAKKKAPVLKKKVVAKKPVIKKTAKKKK